MGDSDTYPDTYNNFSSYSHVDGVRREHRVVGTAVWTWPLRLHAIELTAMLDFELYMEVLQADE